MTASLLPRFGAPRAAADGDYRRWTSCVAIVLALHVAAALVLLTRAAPDSPASLPPAALLIDLAPPAPPPATEPPPPQPQPAPQIEPLPIPAPPPQAVILPPPPPKPKPPERRPVQRIRPPPQPAPLPERILPQTAAAPAPVAAPRAAPAAPPAPDNVLASFKARLLARLEAYKRYPRDAQLRHEQGTAVLRFTMDRQGRVLSAHIERSSGSAALDAEVQAMIERAAPLPPIPPEMPDQLELSVPVRFALK